MNGYYIPHSLYPYIRYDRERDKVDFGTDLEGYFSQNTEVKLEEAFKTFGWVYCTDCKRAVYSMEEALEHINKGHTVTLEFMPDAVAPEEVPPAD